MQKVALRGLLTRKLRSVLTGFAVVIGVAFVVGTLVFTDTINESFKNLFERTQKGVDVELESRQAVKADFSQPPTMPPSVLSTVKSTPGVKVAEGSVSSAVTFSSSATCPRNSSGSAAQPAAPISARPSGCRVRTFASVRAARSEATPAMPAPPSAGERTTGVHIHLLPKEPP